MTSGNGIHLGVLRVWGLKDMAKQHLRVLGHDGAREGTALVSAKVVAISPTTTHKFFEVVAWVNFLVLRRQVVEHF
jgi:hypothetical protein